MSSKIDLSKHDMNVGFVYPLVAGVLFIIMGFGLAFLCGYLGIYYPDYGMLHFLVGTAALLFNVVAVVLMYFAICTLKDED